VSELAADDGSPFVSDDDEAHSNSGASSCPFNVRLVTTDDILCPVTHNNIHVSESSADSCLAACDVKPVLAAQSNSTELMHCGETASTLAGMNEAVS